MAELLISGNGIGNVGVEAIASAARKNTALRRIDLARNGAGVNQRGGDRAAAALAYLLRDNASLTALNISGNNMGDLGMKTARATPEPRCPRSCFSFRLTIQLSMTSSPSDCRGCSHRRPVVPLGGRFRQLRRVPPPPPLSAPAAATGRQPTSGHRA